MKGITEEEKLEDAKVVSRNETYSLNLVYVSSELKTVYAWLNVSFMTVVSINRIYLAKCLVYVSSELKTVYALLNV
jgi:hypothetical protein